MMEVCHEVFYPVGLANVLNQAGYREK